MEYVETGLIGVNNKQIKSGDIVRFEFGYGIVFWDKTTASFKLEFDIDSDALWLYKVEVVDNISNYPNESNRDLIKIFNRKNHA